MGIGKVRSCMVAHAVGQAYGLYSGAAFTARRESDFCVPAATRGRSRKNGCTLMFRLLSIIEYGQTFVKYQSMFYENRIEEGTFPYPIGAMWPVAVWRPFQAYLMKPDYSPALRTSSIAP